MTDNYSSSQIFWTAAGSPQNRICPYYFTNSADDKKKIVVGRKEIVREPTSARKALRIFGYVLLPVSIFITLLVFGAGVKYNWSILVLIFPALLIITSWALIRAGRKKKEVITEEVPAEGIEETTEEEKKKQQQNKSFTSNGITYRKD